MATKRLHFLADESLEYSLVLHLREFGYDITAIAEESPSIADEDVLTTAYRQKRIILTNDKDFGDLVFLNKLKHTGIILFRFKNELVASKIKALDSLLEKYSNELANNFTVVEEDKIRIRS